jgi:hypothetical protein
MTATEGGHPPAGDKDPAAARQKAIRALAERRRRVSRIRRGAIGGSIAAFAAAWVMIFAQLVTGHDPALARNNQATAPAAAATASGASEADSAGGGSYSADPYSESSPSQSSPSESSPPLDSVTTRQS